MVGLTIVCVIFCLVAVNYCGIAPTIEFPGGATLDLGVLSTTIGGVRVPWLYMIFVFLLLAGLSNAVNLTDGLDGLAGGTVLVVMVVMAMVAYNEDQLGLTRCLLPCIMGACVGFLWYNCYPASIFMAA